MISEKIQIFDFFQISKNEILIVYDFYENFVPESAYNNNVIICAFTTSLARLKLYSELEKNNSRVLYCDTDSLIYISKDNLYNPKITPYLGGFSNELQEAVARLVYALGLISRH